MPRIALAGALLLTLTGPAIAAETHLLLSESATVIVTPDEIVASLRIEATSGTAAEAQKRVNDGMRDALATAKETAGGVIASTGGYGVWRTQQNGADRWQGNQNLNLSSHDGGGRAPFDAKMRTAACIHGFPALRPRIGRRPCDYFLSIAN